MSKQPHESKILRCGYCEELFCEGCNEEHTHEYCMDFCSHDCKEEFEAEAKHTAWEQNIENRALNR